MKHRSFQSLIPSPLTVKILYEGTPKDSPVRRLFIDLWSTMTDIHHHADTLPKDFLLDLVVLLRKTLSTAQCNIILASDASAYLEETKETGAPTESKASILSP